MTSEEAAPAPENVVVVAVRAEREVSKAALTWALTHVVHPGDIVTLLAVLSDNHDQKPSWRQRLLWGLPFPRNPSYKRRDSNHNGISGSDRQQERCSISASCSQMSLQIDGQNQINVRIKVVGGAAGSSSSSSSNGREKSVVAAESKRVGANWVVLDKQLKQEEKLCLEELQCNIVVIKGSHAKVLRLNLQAGLGGRPVSNIPCAPFSISSSSCSPSPCSEKIPDHDIIRKPDSSYNDIILKASSNVRKIERASSGFVGEHNPLFYQGCGSGNMSSKEDHAVNSDDASTSNSDGSKGINSPVCPNLGFGFCQDGVRSCDSTNCLQHPLQSAAAAAHNNKYVHHWIPQNHILQEGAEENSFDKSFRSNQNERAPVTSSTITKTLQEKFFEADRECIYKKLLGLHPPKTPEGYKAAYSSAMREVASLFVSSPSVPPPLCSICRHKAPVFGKPPKRFTYQELEDATDGFSRANLVAESRFGFVHRGVLRDGQVVAIKRLTAATTASVPREGDDEFHEQVEMLSRAQHRNVVMLVGFCAELEKPRVLIYEYICNSSLDLHLYGRGKPALDWHARVKIAIGVAKGLRYLHEDCRVGFVVHKDMRPNNILLTHDFEPLVGDFSLTRWKTNISCSMDADAAGTFGYLAPEYIEHGIITEKADVYAFGVVLLELITGRKAMDTTQPTGQQFLVEWARPLLSLASDGNQTIAVERFLDPCLDRDQAHFYLQQLRAMACAASLCLLRDPQVRPSMSKVLRVLERNDAFLDPGLTNSSVPSRSGRFSRPILYQHAALGGNLSLRFPHEAVINALYAEKSWPPLQLNHGNF